MVIKFFNREKELDFLEDAYKKTELKSIMLALYGRRRVGKTELIKEFCQDKKYIYIFLEPKPEKELLEELEETSGNVMGVKPRFDGWEDFFAFIFRQGGIVVFDEFQNLLKVNPLIISKIQKSWDRYQAAGRVFFIAIGSYAGPMKRIFTDRKEPLFGRADFLVNLKPFTFFETCEFIGRDTEEAMQIYALFGGVPKYLIYSILYDDRPLDLARKLFIQEPAPLRDEGKHILTMEFGSEHKGYFSILEAISTGRATPKEIADYTGLNRDTAGKYLHELVNVYSILKKESPVLKKKPRASRYFLADNFYRFWFRFIYRNLSILETDPERLVKIIKEQMNTYLGVIFEDVAREFLITINEAGRFPFRFHEMGRWWHKGEEIDIVALNKETREIAIFECKWSRVDEKRAERILDSLKNKAPLLKWYNGKRKEYYGVVGKTIEGKENLREKGYLVFDLKDLESVSF